MSLMDRYKRITAINACATNYLSSQQLIVDFAKKHDVPQDELPETYCLSDEGFDAQIQGIFAGSSYYGRGKDPAKAWKTTYENI